MSKATRPREPDEPDTTRHDGGSRRPPAVEIDVARTGGFAGITRRWTAQPPPAEATQWISLIDRCPWEEAAPPPADEPPADERPAGEPPAEAVATPERIAVPDGFVWWIRATWSGTDPREAELPDDEVVGAWRDLVDAVRGWSGPSPERPGR